VTATNGYMHFLKDRKSLSWERG